MWDHITGLLADPALIRAEISKRLDAARAADAVTRQRDRLELEAAKAASSITAMIQAYSEQLITIDELRARMPHLRARQATLRGQIGAIDIQAADRDACLQLAGNLESFLAQLNCTAAAASVPERQRVLRLLVKDVLVGPQKITIRHRIPTRADPASASRQTATPIRRVTIARGYPLRWGRDDADREQFGRVGRGCSGCMPSRGPVPLSDAGAGWQASTTVYRPAGSSIMTAC